MTIGKDRIQLWFSNELLSFIKHRSIETHKGNVSAMVEGALIEYYKLGKEQETMYSMQANEITPELKPTLKFSRGSYEELPKKEKPRIKVYGDVDIDGDEKVLDFG